ncbi:aminoacyl-tRNA hydrolase [Fundidesulfovibrio butyratiphilus]
MPPKFLITGLGNPGPKYARTRHNLGFMVADALLSKGRTQAKSFGKDCELATLRLPGLAEEVFVLKPQTYMNLSGHAVARVLGYFKLDPANLVVLHDELDLPFGRMKLKRGGGTAGHNGLKSIVADIGREDFVRLRLGIGRPPGRMEVVSYVLQDFGPREHEHLPEVVDEAVEAVRLFCMQGLEAGMRRAGGFRLKLDEDETPPPRSPRE